jgi:hypothetical protein
MRPGFLACAVIFLHVSCMHSPGNINEPTHITTLPKIGTVLQMAQRGIAISHRGGTLHSYYLDVRGVKFTIDVRSEDKGVVAISTRDRKFCTPEGIRVGDTWSKLSS